MTQKDEPSMEEILSSIKRIIAEDSEPTARRPDPEPASEPEPEPDPEPDVLELTQLAAEPETMRAHEPEFAPDLSVSAEEAPAIADAPVAPFSPPAFDPEPAREQAEALVSAATADASRAAFASLSRMVVKPEDPAADNTLEGLVREMLRPMIKQWLDAHLPDIVQSTVDREIARINGR